MEAAQPREKTIKVNLIHINWKKKIVKRKSVILSILCKKSSMFRPAEKALLALTIEFHWPPLGWTGMRYAGQALSPDISHAPKSSAKASRKTEGYYNSKAGTKYGHTVYM